MVGNAVAHYGRVVGGKLPVKGSPVTLELDWEPRYRAMRLHTAGHILDHAVMRVYGRHVNTLEARHPLQMLTSSMRSSTPQKRLLKKFSEKPRE
jgi:Ser-tRNA(Ala) deacylase AlaX